MPANNACRLTWMSLLILLYDCYNSCTLHPSLSREWWCHGCHGDLLPLVIWYIPLRGTKSPDDLVPRGTKFLASTSAQHRICSPTDHMTSKCDIKYMLHTQVRHSLTSNMFLYTLLKLTRCTNLSQKYAVHSASTNIHCSVTWYPGVSYHWMILVPPEYQITEGYEIIEEYQITVYCI